ncbi:MAG: MotA/TolQ/ExbB proton channel family protein [Leptonema sp. (in: bacteria)]
MIHPTLLYSQESQENKSNSEVQEAPQKKESLWNWIQKGGFTMIPLGLISSIIIGFSIERYIFFKRSGVRLKNYFENFSEKINNLEELEKFLKEDQTIVSRILKIGIQNKDKEISLIEKQIESQSIIELGKLEKGLNLLSNLGNLAPLLGFFGTVVGMRHSFIQFVVKLAPTAKDLASGVEEALITTQAGLLIAIPTYLVYNLFIYWIDSLSVEIERCGNLLINKLYEVQHGNQSK